MAIHRTVSSFRRALNRHAGNVQSNAKSGFRQTLARGGGIMVRITPFDTGYLKSNWDLVPAGQRPKVGRFGSYAELAALRFLTNLEPPLREFVAGQSTVFVIQKAVQARIRQDALKAILGAVYQVANATPYAIRINAGASRQAPAGMTGPGREWMRQFWRRQRLLAETR
ncbi:MAG: hypothetical protein OXE53_13060 [Deltaproteobacteria bacterium]|nr:hypothetical protein [Deltaproteobacteria bacterium]